MKSIVFYLLIFLSVCSCSQEDSEDMQPTTNNLETPSNFYALTVGNSWVYKNYKYNSSTQEYDETSVIDSVSIVGVEIISGIKYYKFRRFTTGNDNNITFCNQNGEYFEFLREIDGDLVKDDGEVKFSNNNFSQRLIFDDDWGNIYENLVPGNTLLNVEAGTLNCVNSERYAITENGDQLEGLDKFYYSDGVGLIYDTQSFAILNYPSIIRRLYSYSIQ